MIGVIFSLALILLSFPADQGASPISQVFGITIFICASVLVRVLASGQNSRDIAEPAWDRDTLLPLLMIIVLPSISSVDFVLRGDLDGVWKTLIFCAVAFSCRLAVSTLGLVLFCGIFFVAMVIFSILAAVSDPYQLIDALSQVVTDGSGRVRFGPFEIHPNLAANIFAAAVLVGVFFAIRLRKVVNLTLSVMLYGGISLLGTELLATGSRGGCFALLATGVLLLARRARGLGALRLTALIVVVVGIVLPLILQAISSDLFMDTFELNSSQRGLDSGLSGRTDNWEDVIAMSFSDTRGFLMGNGFRSWDGLKGIETDSSYINLLFEFGLIPLFLLLAMILRRVFIYFKSNFVDGNELAAGLLILALIEAAVARYLIGIGNPASLLTLTILVSPVLTNSLDQLAIQPIRAGRSDAKGTSERQAM